MIKIHFSSLENTEEKHFYIFASKNKEQILGEKDEIHLKIVVM